MNQHINGALDVITSRQRTPLADVVRGEEEVAGVRVIPPVLLVCAVGVEALLAAAEVNQVNAAGVVFALNDVLEL